MNRFNNLMPKLITAISVLTTCAMSNAAVIFSDNFQSDTAGQSGQATDLDPVIGAGDFGGVWDPIENPALSVQVINDTVPGNAIAGANNYMRVYRASTSTRGAPYAQGWIAADTTDQVVQLDMLVYRPTSTPASALSVFFGTGGHNTNVNSGVNAFATASSVQASLDAGNFPADQWTPVRIMANLSSSTTQLGIAPQQWTLSVNNGAPTATAFSVAANQVPVILVGLSQNNETFNYIDDVTIQVVPEPTSIGLFMVGFIGMIVGRRKK